MLRLEGGSPIGLPNGNMANEAPRWEAFQPGSIFRGLVNQVAQGKLTHAVAQEKADRLVPPGEAAQCSPPRKLPAEVAVKSWVGRWLPLGLRRRGHQPPLRSVAKRILYYAFNSGPGRRCRHFGCIL